MNFAKEQYRKAARVADAVYGRVTTPAEADRREMLAAEFFKNQEPDPTMWGYGKTAVQQTSARTKFMIESGIAETPHCVY